MNEKFKKLRSLFLSRASIDKIFDLLNDAIGKDFNDDNQILIFSNTYDCDTARDYPLPRSYSLKFLKELINQIENSHHIVNESIYNDYIELMNQRTEDDYHFITYTICGQEFTFKQSDKLVTDGTTGLKSWCGGLQLFEQIYANKDRIFKNKRILELGSGLGLAGICLSALCDLESYTFTDHHEKVIELIKENLEINGFNINGESDKKSNKFYEFEDEEGNVSAKYYNEKDDDQEQFSNSFSSNFTRQGPMNLESSLNKKNEFDFGYKFDKFNLNEKTDELFSFSKTLENNSNVVDDDHLIFKPTDDLFKVDMDEKFKKIDEKIDHLKNEKMINFEEFLKNFEEKLSLLDENVKKIKNKSLKVKSNLRNKNKPVNLDELDWYSSNNQIIDKLTKYKPDYIIGSDIVYDPSIIPDLIRVFKLCLSTLDCGLIILCSIRNEETIKEFEKQLRQAQNDDKNIKIQRSKLSAKLSFIENVELSNNKFVLYNIRNDDEDD